ncbi:DUF4269 domain-containing protein [Cohnella sp. AR92]|uniref:DUF4269 domain-containing protein n=1 Tax=Cohnella sp. AR92 TaxID=648716 RepID=UPI000F8F3811|nr:DUF4269 domain-containing protein [Cohnella sp. AR92]RUS45817.1 DUF4269 domain-containing protein [Cohnella sp. AR92]
MATRWTDLAYLSSGTAAQQEIFALLQRTKLLVPLLAHRPVLVGTFPIGIEVPGSDLDIICEVKDMDAFGKLAETHYGQYESFEITRDAAGDGEGRERIVVNFAVSGWPIEVYGENKPTDRQNGYLHMVVEDRLLRHYGESFRERIIRLKRGGLKTEPAFAKALGLTGDPYERLLEMADWPEGKWADFLAKQPNRL